MRLIDTIRLKMEICMNNILERGKTLEEIIDDAPDADAVPVVHGRWIGEEINIETCDISATLQECSVCHRIRPVDAYCSHCGAKMDLPESGE